MALDNMAMMAHIIPQVPASTPEASPLPLSFSNLIRTRSSRRTTQVEEQFPKQSRRNSILRKLAGPRENAKRFLRLRTPGNPALKTTTSSPPQSVPPPRRTRPVSEIIVSPRVGNHPVDDEILPAPMMADVLPRALPQQINAVPILSTPFPPLRNEKIVATGSGLTVGIALTEPVLYLQGYDQHDPSSKKSAILRGQIHLKVTKSVKIKKISICFRGHAQTDWPDGTTFDPLPQI